MRKIWFAGVLILAVATTGCYYTPCIQGYGSVVEETRDVYDFTEVTNNASFEVRVSNADTFMVVVEAQDNLMQFIETHVSGSTLVVETQNGICLNPGAPVIVRVSMPQLESVENTGSGRLFADRGENHTFDCQNTGSGLVRVDSVFAENIFLENTGSGKLEMEAAFASEADMLLTGSGTLDAGNLFSAEEVNIKHTGSGRLYATMLEGYDVDVEVTGSGRVELAGDVEEAGFRQDGSGKIDALELVAIHVKATITGSGKIYTYAVETLDVIISGSGNVLYLGDPVITERNTGTGNVRPY